MGLSYRWRFRRCPRETGLAAKNDSLWKNWELTKESYDGSRRDVVNAVLISIMETHEAPHLPAKFKLLATSGIPTSIAKSCMKVQATQVERVGHTTFSSSASPVRVPSEEATKQAGNFT